MVGRHLKIKRYSVTMCEMIFHNKFFYFYFMWNSLTSVLFSHSTTAYEEYSQLSLSIAPARYLFFFNVDATCVYVCVDL